MLRSKEEASRWAMVHRMVEFSVAELVQLVAIDPRLRCSAACTLANMPVDIDSLMVVAEAVDYKIVDNCSDRSES